MDSRYSCFLLLMRLTSECSESCVGSDAGSSVGIGICPVGQPGGDLGLRSPDSLAHRPPCGRHPLPEPGGLSSPGAVPLGHKHRYRCEPAGRMVTPPPMGSGMGQCVQKVLEPTHRVKPRQHPGLPAPLLGSFLSRLGISPVLRKTPAVQFSSAGDG